ncbi:hypothetical protein D3C85_1296390 [compost metagenome]
MSSIESWMVPETVQLMVEVAGRRSCAPALATMRPAGMAPLRSAQRNCAYQCSRSLGASTSATARATRRQVASMSASTGVPSGSSSWYFCAQMSAAAACSGMLPAPGGADAPCLAMGPDLAAAEGSFHLSRRSAGTLVVCAFHLSSELAEEPGRVQ